MNRFALVLAATLALTSFARAEYQNEQSTSILGVAPEIGCGAGVKCAGPVSNSNPMPVTGYDSGIVRAAASPSAAAHSAGQAVGGLFVIPVARVSGGSGLVTSLLASASWGSTQSYVVRVWAKNPTNTTCTDGASYAGSAIDDANLIGGGPTSISFAAPASTTGDAKTYAALTGLTWDYKNLDATPTQNLYACLVTTGADTPGASASLSVSLSGPQN